MASEVCAVTGAFSYTGRYITQRLLSMGIAVKTLTGHPERPHPFGDRVTSAPLDFDRPDTLRRSLEGVDTFYNTYWIRFPHGRVTFEQAVDNTKVLLQAAREAGVRRIVHIGVTGVSGDSPLPYFQGKALQEEVVKGSGLPYAIVRPTLVFGAGDVLINNIAWTLRRFFIFAMPGDGSYRVQPVAAEDVARIAVEAGRDAANVALDAAGPDTFTFEDMVRMIGAAVGSKARIIHVAPKVAFLGAAMVGRLVHDVVLTKEEAAGLMAELLISTEPPRGRISFRTWVRENARILGTKYASELDRHYR